MIETLRERILKSSLRDRLIISAVSLVAVGLIAASAATYVLLRNTLVDRVDKQLMESTDEALDFLQFPGELGRGHRIGGGPSSSVPFTYARLQATDGSIVKQKGVDFLRTVSPNLDLPEDLPGSSRSKATDPALFTASSNAGLYRVIASPAYVRGTRELFGTLIVASPLGDVQSTLRRLMLIEGIVALFVLGGVIAGAKWLVQLGLRPLTQMEGTAAEIAAGDLSRRVEPADPETEVGRLGLALNSMLSKIEAAFAERRASEAKLRRFVADASHELRTPLTSIRGYAELFRQGARKRPADLEKSMQRIEEESARMGELVEELLLLARLDQGRPLDHEPVDLTEIARDAVEDARAVDPQRPIDITVPFEAIVTGDDARLRQVTANLLANALEHTPAGTPVHVRLAVNDVEATLEVADEGPGLAPEDADRVFDRFFRVDPARARESGGAGLGLSIVAAIVHAHGGRVTLVTSPGAGARFIVTIPRVASPSESPDAPQEAPSAAG